MEWKLRPFNAATATAAAFLGRSVASSIAHAEMRQVGGTKAVWDKACVKSTSCLPVGGLAGMGQLSSASGKSDPLKVIQGN